MRNRFAVNYGNPRKVRSGVRINRSSLPVMRALGGQKASGGRARPASSAGSAAAGLGFDPALHVAELVAFALQHLADFQNPSRLFCFEKAYDAPERRGESPQASLQILLGLARARAAGYEVATDLEDLLGRCVQRRATFTAGDIGLALWADARLGAGVSSELLAQLERDEIGRKLGDLVGMDVAWLTIGLANQVDIGNDDLGLLRASLAEMQRRQTPSGLLQHYGSRRPRRRFPNFATQIYSIQALALAARSGRAPTAAPTAERIARRIIDLQLPDGGWPWLFDARRGTVVERYEIYAVHQDAMAPMALLELSDITGDPSYATAAVAGLAWSRGQNELQADLLDGELQFALRSIRRRRPASRVALAQNVARSVLGVPVAAESGAPEVNRTCRPYHLGWILEAWAGREHHPALGFVGA